MVLSIRDEAKPLLTRTAVPFGCTIANLIVRPQFPWPCARVDRGRSIGHYTRSSIFSAARVKRRVCMHGSYRLIGDCATASDVNACRRDCADYEEIEAGAFDSVWE